MRARALRRADDRAQVVRVGDLVADDDQGLFALFARDVQNVLHTDVFAHARERDDALMGVRATHKVELALVRVHDHHTGGAGGRGDVAERFVGLTLLNENFVDGRARAQRLDHGVAALNDAVRLRVLRSDGLFPAFLIHKRISPCHKFCATDFDKILHCNYNTEQGQDKEGAKQKFIENSPLKTCAFLFSMV